MPKTLDLHPAFGFEWGRRWNVAADQRDTSITARGGDPKNAYHRQWSTPRMYGNNVAKALSYIPIFSILTGLGRMTMAYLDRTNDPEKRAILNRHFTRGALEVLFGPLLLLADLAKTYSDWTFVRNQP
jgi:hypothetical protein